MTAGKLRDWLEFQQRTNETDALGGQSENWVIQFTVAAEVIHLSGDERVEAARIAGRELYKIRVRSETRTQALSTDSWRFRDARRNVLFNILSLDAVTDRKWVWLRAETTQPSGTTYDTGGVPLVTPPDDDLFENLPDLP
ncbi:MAG: phage head closure protein [Pseudomonadota bacterium]